MVQQDQSIGVWSHLLGQKIITAEEYGRGGLSPHCWWKQSETGRGHPVTPTLPRASTTSQNSAISWGPSIEHEPWQTFHNNQTITIELNNFVVHGVPHWWAEVN
jgi:hypothetical protein